MQRNERLLQELQNLFGANYSFQFDAQLVVDGNDLLPVMKQLKEQFLFGSLVDVCGVDNLHRKKKTLKRFESVYHLLNMETGTRLRIRVPIDDMAEVPSVAEIYPVAHWQERETWDLLGIVYRGIPQERLLTHHQFQGHPLRKDYPLQQRQLLSESLAIDSVLTRTDPHRQLVNIGPYHPTLGGSLRIMAELDGEIVRQSVAEIGYLHRGVEKLCEGQRYNQIIPFMDRLNYYAASMGAIGWCKAVEELMGIEIPAKSQMLRMIFAELSRIVSHCFCIAHNASILGNTSAAPVCYEHIELLYGLFEKFCGARITLSLPRIGGLGHDMPIGWVAESFEVAERLEKGINKISKMITQSSIWKDQLRGCVVSAADAIAWGYSGPVLRGSGVNYDIRKNTPYYFYRDVEFEVPLGRHGDSYDRLLVRLEEMRQSLKIVLQLLDNIPAGSVMVEDERILAPDKDLIATDQVARDHYFRLLHEGINVPAGEIYSATESAEGELGFFVISEGGNVPYRVKINTPSFAKAQFISNVIYGERFSDATVGLGSFNIVPGELDR